MGPVSPRTMIQALSSRQYGRYDKAYAVSHSLLAVLFMSINKVFLGIWRGGHMCRDMGSASVGFVDE